MTPAPVLEEATKILIVEDEGIVAWDIEHNLRDLGFEVVGTASSGEEALAMADATVPNLVLMDVRIQGDMDGIETARVLSARYAVPVVYLTAHSDATTVDRAKRTEPLAYLLKPFKKSELRTAVEVALYRHRIEKRLRERERLLSTTLRSIGDGVITTDMHGNVTFMNPVAEAITGWTDQDAAGCALADVIRLQDPRSGQAMVLPFEEVIQRRVTHVIAEGQLVSRQGSPRCVADSLAPVADDDEVYGAVMVFHDITEQRQLQRQLELADRLSSLGVMAAGIGHEINNPLVSASANIDFVQRELESCIEALETDPQQTKWGTRLREAMEALNDAALACGRIARIARDLTAYGRGLQPSSGCTDPNTVVSWAAKVTEYEWRQAGVLEQNLEKIPLVAADETRLGQVLVNLIMNASHALRQAKPRGGIISVSTRVEPGALVVIEVRDTGCGMSPAVQQRIFEPFFTTKPAGLGTGLGLPVSRQIIESMGGSLEVESEEGTGTIMRLCLPAATNSVLQALSPQGHAALLPALLVIDDEPLVCRALQRTLGSVVTVTAVQSAAAALELLKDGKPFDLVLYDLMLPGMSGLQFYRALQQHAPELSSRLVFMNEYSSDPQTQELLLEHTIPTLAKPFEPLRLRRMVLELIAHGGGLAKNE